MKIIEKFPGFVNVRDCPCCRRMREGLIVVDASSAIRLASRNTDQIDVKVDIGDRHDVVVFDPDRPQRRPCSHVVSLLIDIELRRNRRGEHQQPLSYAATFDHAWFAEQDKDNNVNEFLWTEVMGGYDLVCHPITPYKICEVDRIFVLNQNQLVVKISGRILVAMSPRIFFAELAEGYNRWQSE